MGNPKHATLVSSLILYVNFIGLWHGNKRYDKRLLVLIAMVCYFSTYASQLVALVMSKDSKQFFECFSVISFCGMGILKFYSMCCKSERWLSLLDQMSQLEKEQLKPEEDLSAAEYQSDNEEDNSHVPGLIKNYTKKYNRTSTILFKIYFFTGAIFIMSPFIEYTFIVSRSKELEVYPHILPSWNPLDNVHFICYMVTIIFETVAAIYCVGVHIAFDLTVIGVMIFVCGQFASLVYQSEKIGGKGKMCNLSRTRDVRAHFRITKCHRIHVKLIGIINELDKLLRNILGVYFLLATLTVCSVAVRLKSEQMSVMQLVSLLQYMCATLIQLYVYCSYGDAVYHESAIFPGQGPFGAAIWCLSPKIRREIAILGSGMIRPRRLHAGLFNTVDLPSFIQIVRAAYSYYAVLGNIKQN